MALDLKIGSPVWLDNHNPTWDGIEELIIAGETSRSWVVNRYGREYLKIPKSYTEFSMTIPSKFGSSKTLWLNKQAMDDATWMGKNLWGISDLVKRVRDIETLRAVAKLIGYEEEKGEDR